MNSRHEHYGKCHCGSVSFKIIAPKIIELIKCNCSICSMTGFLHLIVAKQYFELLQGNDKLTSYQFNTKQANHLFCSICGVKSFYFPRSHPGGVSINFNCLDQSDIEQYTIKSFDGKHWEQNIQDIK